MPGTASFASVQDPETWASFDAAVETAADDDPVAGIGFVFTEDDPFVGVDLDDCRNAETGEADSWAHEIIEQLDSFTEVSPSGTGYHVYVRGELPDGGNRSGTSSATSRRDSLRSLGTGFREHLTTSTNALLNSQTFMPSISPLRRRR